MHDRAQVRPGVGGLAARLAREAAIVARRLERLFGERATGDGAVRWNLRGTVESLAQGPLPEPWPDDPRSRGAPGEVHPIDRVAQKLRLSPVELDLVYLAGAADAHEALAAVFRALHPSGEPRPTFGLAASLFCRSEEERRALRIVLLEGVAVRAGLLTLRGDGPLTERSLGLPDGLWQALQGEDAWPAGVSPYRGPVSTEGLEPWLSGELAEAAARALGAAEPLRVVVTAPSSEDGFHRGLALARHAGIGASGVSVGGPLPPHGAMALALHALVRDTVLVVRDASVDRSAKVDASAGPGASGVLGAFDGHALPLVFCTTGESLGLETPHPVLTLPAAPLAPARREPVWASALPELRADAAALALRYRLEPWAIRRVAEDAELRARIAGRRPCAADVSDAVRARTSLGASAVVQLVRPTAGWSDLVLSQDRKSQLYEAVDRLKLQTRVLDRWGFLAGRPGARGVRMLLSGPPGVGKTLSAEVIARELEVDLLVVDVSRVVSKWIGETEKNLSEVFDIAERSQCVLLFDEADALFGKRTEVSDARDRYANMETAYLLARLERFEGLTVLSTNLKQNVDSAFIRRLEFIVELPEPTVDHRITLWRAHLRQAPELDERVDLAELAALYPVVGATIRNAAVGAAFLAAHGGDRIRLEHIVFALRREYQKLGRAFPGLPTTLTDRDFDSLMERGSR
jgi:hypothetical protein